MKFYVVCPDCQETRDKKNIRTLAVWRNKEFDYYSVKCYHPNPNCQFQKYQVVFTPFWETDLNIVTELKSEKFIIPIPDDVILKYDIFKFVTDNTDHFLFTYRNTKGEILFYKVRTQDKKFFYISLTKAGWVNRKPKLDCLFNAQYIPIFENILIVEGEKTARYANTFLSRTSWRAVCGPNGSTTDGMDLSLLTGKNVVCWPDNDKPGIEFAEVLRTKHGIPRVKVEELNLPEKWDLGDNLSDNLRFNVEEVEMILSQTTGIAE